ncbi:MAG: hypothetical protein HY735_24640 [Verrucomicrobia bacterium]|nr:hypothetical protein [Verrucomicrobiota bacterium]
MSSDPSWGFVVKFDPQGKLLWARQNGGNASCVALDQFDNAYVVGRFMSTAAFGGANLTSLGRSDVIVAKYDAAGQVLWARRAGGNGEDVATAIALDHLGNVYVAESFTGNATRALIKSRFGPRVALC